MPNPHSQNRKKLLIIFGMSVIPFVIAVVLDGKASFIKGSVNHGELIAPVVPTERTDFIGFDPFSNDNIKELEGHWVMLNIVPQQFCEKVCLEAIYKTKQLRLMMNKDLTRVRRAILFVKELKPDTVNGWLKDDQVLLRIKPSQSLLGKISAIRRGTIPDGMLILIDPLGNLMMQYEPGFDPYKVKSDLMHLLRVSQIG